jgi:hypothetical protein
LLFAESSSTISGKNGDKSEEAPRRERRRFAETANDSVTSKNGDGIKVAKHDSDKDDSRCVF